MLDKLKDLDLRYEDLESQLGDPRVYGDAEKLRQVNRELKELLPVVETYRAYQAADSRRREAEELLHDPEMKEMAQDELAEAKEELEQLKEKLTILLLPRDPNDSRNVILEIRGGVGGEESALFAHSLLRMYTMYAESHGWKLEIASINETELGGVKDCSAVIEGDGAWSRLKFESGVHRVQRVPETESGGRIHTSAATVAVLPEMEAVEVALNPADVEMQVFRASGAGGQHVNKTSSAVRLIHKPTGTVVECQAERSQFQNREKAMRLLASQLYDAEQEKRESRQTAERRSQVGSGDRSQRVRTYNYPQGRVTDHRIGLTLHQLPAVLDGGLDPIIDALAAADTAAKLEDYLDQALAAAKPEQKLCFLGDGVERYRTAIEARLGQRAVFAPAQMSYLRPAAVAALAWQNRENAVDYLTLQPHYLRAPQAERARAARLAAEGKA